MEYRKKKTKEEFLQKFKEKYPDYEILSFTSIDKPMIIKDLNGVLYKKNHAHRFLSHNIRFDCVVDKDKYIQNKLNELKTGLFLVKFNGMKEKIVVKDSQGFTYSPQAYDLLQGHTVTIESCNEKEELFKYKANLKHNNKYTYKEFVYTNSKQKIPIVCPIHDLFYTSVESHLFGCGCPTCKKEKASFSKSIWIDNNKNKQCIFYVLEFFNDSEVFIKIGVTSVSIKKRYSNKQNDYKYKVLLEMKGDSKFISNLESRVIEMYKDLKYIPLLKFEGKTECFRPEIKNKIYEQFKS